MPKESKRDTKQIDAIESKRKKKKNPKKKLKKRAKNDSDSKCETTFAQNLVLGGQHKDLGRRSNSDLSESITSRVPTTGADAGPSRENSTDSDSDQDAVAGPSTSHSDDIIKTDSDEQECADVAPLDLTQEGKPVAHGTSPQSAPLDLSVPVTEQRREKTRWRGVTINTQNEWVIETLGKQSLSEMNQRGVCIVRDFMKENVVKQILKEVQQMESAGCFGFSFFPGPPGHPPIPNPIHQIYSIVRNSPGATAIYKLTKELDHVVGMCALAKNRDIRLERSEPRVEFDDPFQQCIKKSLNPVKDGRFMTAVYYLNHDWDEHQHGGTLRVYSDNMSSYIEVQPKINTAIFFWSDMRSPQTLYPTYRRRYFISVTYKVKHKENAKEKNKQHQEEKKRHEEEKKKHQEKEKQHKEEKKKHQDKKKHYKEEKKQHQGEKKQHQEEKKHRKEEKKQDQEKRKQHKEEKKKHQEEKKQHQEEKKQHQEEKKHHKEEKKQDQKEKKKQTS